jgi:galactose mutarotase-like enzyme
MAVDSISNKEISISVNSHGAELTSLRSGATELLWQSDKAVWPRYAPVLFPLVGKLKNDRFRYKDEAYSLSQHGFARDREFTLIEKSESVLEFELTADEETLKIYPFHFSFRIIYELQDDNLKIRYQVFNPDKKDLLFSVGAHPGFNCKRENGESLNDFYLDFEGKNELIIEKLDNGLLSGETSVIKLNEGKLPLNVKLFDNDALVCKNNQIDKVVLCSVRSKAKIVLNCKNWPYFGIWAKKGSDAFVCLEPWYGIADNINSSNDLNGKEGIIQLSSYKSFEAEFNIEIKN